jgi:hippurate hydrolase
MISLRLAAVGVLLTGFVVTGSGREPQAPQSAGAPAADAGRLANAADAGRLADRSPEWIKSRLQDVDAKLDGEAKDLVSLYQHLHSNPELSLTETKTAARLAEEIKKLGFEVTEKVGGTGIVGVLKNGPGPVVLLRTDMDALPIIEQTGVPYASKVRVKDRFGNDVGVMHACGHDIHMTSWVGTARVMAALKDKWSGTLVLIGQPAEEIGAGARMMLEDGLYKRFPKPDYAVALHADPLQPAGVVSYSEGLALANADTVDLLVKGKGGHGAAPHATIDPIVLSARIILDLQTIVSRETNPLDPVVVTVGSIHGGTKHNIIPNEVKLQLTVRTTKTETRDRVLKAIDRIAKAAAIGAQAPEPVMTVNLDEFTPATFNDVTLARKTGAVFKEILGEKNVKSRQPLMGAEDFGRYGQGGIPTFMFFLGSISAEKYEASLRADGPKLPGMHTDAYAPIPEPSIRTGVRTECLALLNLLGK